ncbi:MAG: tape measure protein [Gammaproteobacteria bacterium]|nr:tape measure protein [Gammaproteobacteria bacterium]
MANGPNLRVRISADLADIKQGLGLLRGDLAKLKQQAAQSMPNLGSNAAVAGVRRLRSEVLGLVGAYVSLRGVGLLSGMADEASLVRGRIRSAKGDYQALLALANETRSSFASTVDLYARMERATRNQGVTQERLLAITRTVNQAVKLSYADVGTANAALTQFAQGLAAGVLRGQDLNSVLAGTPVLAEAIAKGMGKQVGEIKKLGEQGKLTTDQVLKALEKQAAAVAKEYGEVPVTVQDALTQIRNAFVDYIGDQDEATGASRRFAETLIDVAKELPRYLDPVLNAVRLLLENLDALAVYMITRFAGAAIPAMIVGFTRLVALIKGATTATITLRGALMLLGGPVGIAVGVLSAALYLLWKRTNDAKVAAEEHRKAMADNVDMAKESREAALEDAKAKRQQALDTLKAAQAELELQRSRLEAARTSTQRAGGGRGGYLRGGVEAAAGTAVEGAEREVASALQRYEDWGRRLVEMAMEINQEVIDGTAGTAEAATEETDKIAGSNALLRDSIARTLAALDRMYADSEIGITQYFQARRRLQEQAIDAEMAQLRMQLAVTEKGEQRRKIEEALVKLQRDRAELAAATDRDQKKALDELSKGMDQFYLARLENEGRVAEAVRARLEEEHAAQIVALQKEGRDEDVRTIRMHIDAEAAKAQLGQFEDQMAQTLARLQSTEQSLSAQAEAGMLGFLESESLIRDARTAAMEQLQELRQKAIDFLATLSADSPEAAKTLEFLRQLDGEVAVVGSSLQRFRQQVADAATDSLSNFFMDLVEGSKSAGEALKDFVRGFALAMAQIAARALATYLVLQLLDAVYPGLGKATAAMMGAGQNHDGGLAGKVGGVRRRVPPALVGAAPRYHNGGIAGSEPLKNNEVVSVLERGEEVLTRNDPRHRDNLRGGAGGGGSVVKTPIVAIGDRAVADALAGAAGEDVVITHVRNNWQALSRG